MNNNNKNTSDAATNNFLDSLNPEKQFGNEMFNKTMKYQKKYNFKSDPDPKKATWNNEADAFKHTFMQAVLSMRYGDSISHALGNKHEKDGDKNKQPSREKNMDLWNNAVGREIAKELKQELQGAEKNYKPEQIEDMIAEKIMRRMKKGELITDPFKDKRLFENSKYNGRVYIREELDPKNMKSEEFRQHEKAIMKDMSQGKILSKAQAEEKVHEGSLIWIEPYTREDGAQVRGHYRKVGK